MNVQRALTTAATAYQLIRERIMAVETDLDERTLADTVEGLTDLHEILASLVRSALIDEAQVEGLRGHVSLLQSRLSRIGERATAKRRIAREVMMDLGLQKVVAPDFTISHRTGQPSLVVVDEALIPEAYFEPREPRLNRLELTADLKRGVAVNGVTFSNPEPVLSVRIR